MSFIHRYQIQIYIKTLNENYTNITDEDGQYNFPGFDSNSIHFEPFDFNMADGHIGYAWIATSYINADDAYRALRKFLKKLQKITEKISFVGQAYISVDYVSFLIIREDSIAMFRYIYEDEPAPLMFMDDHLSSLKILLKEKSIPTAFYKFWNQAVNSANYFGKLAMMFSAIDTFRVPNGGIDISMRDKIFGEKLSSMLYKQDNKGFRHRLIHGLSIGENEEKYYWLRVHKAVVAWFNNEVLINNQLSIDIVDPQRNFNGNLQGASVLLKEKTSDSPLSLKSVLSYCDKSDINNVFEAYESVHENPSIKEFWIAQKFQHKLFDK